MKTLIGGKKKPFIGVIHLLPLPGAPRWKGSMQAVIDRAVEDARSYARGGADAVFIENYGDLPFTPSTVGPETVAAMAVAAVAVRRAINLPIGFNVLRNDARAALALCAASGSSFIRVNILTGAMLTDQGIIQGDACNVLRYKERLCPRTLIFADVHVKHGFPFANQTIQRAARDTLERGLADALIVSGTGTGEPAIVSDLVHVRQACPSAKILLGSGVTADNIGEYLSKADGFIVGTSLKYDCKPDAAVDVTRVTALARKIRNA